jgi:hypothetical protein
VGAFGEEVLIDALAEFGGVYADDVVLAAVVVHGAAEDAGSDVLLMDFGAAVFQGLATHVDEEIAQTRRATELGAGGDAVNERTALLDGRSLEVLLRVRVN